jgi:hypothetical protein
MDHNVDELQPTPKADSEAEDRLKQEYDDLRTIRSDFQSRLVMANLRTEAIRAGMIDLDGLKLVDLSTVILSDDDQIVGGQNMMDGLRRNKPWLFGVTSSSSTAIAPVSKSVQQKMAIEMTDKEYAVARTAITKYQF